MEVGRDATNHLFAQLLRPQRRIYSSWAEYAEVLAALNRRRNTGQISQSVFNRVLFFSADQRLLRAAQAEGLLTFNPETGVIADLDRLIT